MAKKLSEYLGISEEVLQAEGVFDPILSVDSKFFIDPKSLELSTVKEFEGAHKKLTLRYTQIFELIAASKTKNDKFWKAAYRHFPKGEVEEICVGHGFDTTEGRGIGPKLVDETMDTIKEFIDVGIIDPVLLELVGMFQKGIGSDLVSDMIATALEDDIIRYTTRITDLLAKSTSVKPIEFTHGGNKERAFYNPYNEKRVFLLPVEVLQPIPVADDWDSIDRVSAHNSALRSQFAKMVGAFNWKAARRANKDALKNAMLAHPEVVEDLLRQYGEKSAKQKYNFKLDPNGEYSWYDATKKYTTENPLELQQVVKPEDVDKVVKRINERYQDFVENKGGWTSIYTKGENKKVMHEHYAQKLYYGMADAYCDANDLDISPETNGGHGPVDFKFSHGRKAKVLVEIKLTSNSQLAHGFTTQVGEYEKAEKPHNSYYLVLEVSDQSNHTKALNTEIADALNKKKRTPMVHYVNAKIQKSASKA
jgi:hypothetical protein